MILFILNECPYQALSRNVREWARLRTSLNPDSRPHTKLTIHHTLHKKTFFFQGKNLHENLRLREKLRVYRSII